MTIIFYGQNDEQIPAKISRLTDRCIDRARINAEIQHGGKLPVDPKTGYPSFTVYGSKGEEIGGA